MLRHLRFVLLLLVLAAYTSAWTFPEGFLKMPRQAAAIAASGASPAQQAGGSGTTSSQGPNTSTSPTTTDGGDVTTSTTTTSTSTPTTAPTTTSPTPPPTTTSEDPTTTTSPINTTPTTTTTTPAGVTTSSSINTPTTSQSTGPITSHSVTATSTNADPTTSSSINPTAVHETLTTIIITSKGHTSTAVAKATVTGSTVPTWTGVPGFAQGDGGSSSTLSDVGKKIIAGLVGGIGGALLLAGIAFVVYRIWFRKNRNANAHDDDFFSTGSDSVAGEKKSTSQGGWGPSSLTSKFSEPLDRYKSPTSPQSLGSGYKSPQNFNAASNF